jgi:molybdopterin molybdotransferase
MLLITGGVSVGKYDLVKEVLSSLGVEMKFWRVNIKPGKPLLFGKWRRVLVFGLPGNPVSTSVTFLQFVRPALLTMCGCRDVQPMRFSAKLEHDFSKADGKRHYVRGIAVRRKRELHVAAIGSQSSGAMSSMAKANCLMIIPEDTTILHKGHRVEIEFL